MKWRKILWPFSLLYGTITSLRNIAFNQGLLPSHSYDIPVISVGNLSTGGTGKTPMVEFLIEKLKDKKIAMVSRGYGRKTRGVIKASVQSSAEDIGDEPFQVFMKFPQISLVVSERRVEGINHLLKQDSPEVILLDDAFQHRYVKPAFSILLSTYDKPFYKDLILPAGNLRESAKGSKRADIIVITKCPPTLSEALANNIKDAIKPNGKPVFFSTLEYEGLTSVITGEHLKEQASVIALTGIASPESFIEEVSCKYNITRHLNYKDHHRFSANDIAHMEDMLDKDPKLSIATTEKDWVRIKDQISTKVKARFFYLPVRVKILFDEENQLIEAIRSVLNREAMVTNY